ncbi:Uncharacterized protein SCF082_LOCUS22849, partial [Durusdinium trenchii]
MGRQFALSPGCQNLPRRVLAQACDSSVQDWDIVNTQPTLCLQLCEKLNLTGIPSLHLELNALREYVDTPARIRELLTEFSRDPKQLVIAVLNGQDLTVEQSDHTFLRALAKDSLILHWIAVGLLPDLHEKFIEEKRAHPERTTLHYMWTVAEDCCLRSWMQFLQTRECRHLSLHFDGIRVNGERSCLESDFGAVCAKAVRDDTGFDVSIREKQASGFLGTIFHADCQCAEVDLQHWMQEGGRCVPIALSHLDGLGHDVNTAIQKVVKRTESTEGHQYIDFKDIGVVLVPSFGLAVQEIGTYLLHLEDQHGRPHCIAINHSTRDNLTLVDINRSITLSMAQLLDAYQRAFDRSIIVTIKVQKAVVADWQKHALLKLKAGAGRVIQRPAAATMRRPAAHVQDEDHTDLTPSDAMTQSFHREIE